MYEPEDIKRFERHIDAMIRKCDDTEAVEIMLGFERRMQRRVNERLAEMCDDEGFSLAYLASGTSIGRQSIWARVKRGRATLGTERTR